MTKLLVGKSLSGTPATVTIGQNTVGQKTPRVRHDADQAWEMAMEFLRLWNWVENQDRHVCHEEKSKKHHKNGAQDQDLTPRSKEGAQSLMRDASYEPDQQQNSPSRMKAGSMCWEKFESDILGNQGDHFSDLGYFGSSLSPDTNQLGNLETAMEHSSSWVSCKFAHHMREALTTLCSRFIFSKTLV